MPDGYRIPPHFHPTDETVEVKQGTFLVADTLDVSKAKAMKLGGVARTTCRSHR